MARLSGVYLDGAFCAGGIGDHYVDFTEPAYATARNEGLSIFRNDPETSAAESLHRSKMYLSSSVRQRT